MICVFRVDIDMQISSIKGNYVLILSIKIIVLTYGFDSIIVAVYVYSQISNDDHNLIIAICHVVYAIT